MLKEIINIFQRRIPPIYMYDAGIDNPLNIVLTNIEYKS